MGVKVRIKKAIKKRRKKVVRNINRSKINKIIINRYKQVPNDFFFIQVGSSDGITNDPIHDYIVKYKWKGILVEPVEYLFNRLLRTYASVVYPNRLFLQGSCVKT